MSDLVAPVEKGKVVTNNTTTSNKSNSNSKLGKEEFLKLLVTQMKYQDPLNPSTDTEYVAQLATFSQLEQMQNLNATTMNSQAFNLVGKTVVMSSTNSSGKTVTTEGVVDYVTMSGGKTFLSIGGSLYSIDNLQTVVGEDYIASQNAPKVKATKATYDKANPKDIQVEISLGNDKYAAGSVAVILNGKAVAPENLAYSNGKLTIKKEALESLDVGKYAVAFVFDDVNITTVTDKVSLEVSNSANTENE